VQGGEEEFDDNEGGEVEEDAPEYGQEDEGEGLAGEILDISAFLRGVVQAGDP
jgi:hypothetical protein